MCICAAPAFRPTHALSPNPNESTHTKNTGDVIRFHPNVKAVVFPTLHRVPSQGYAFVREQSKGLKAEYRSLSSRDLGALRKQGVEVSGSGGWGDLLVGVGRFFVCKCASLVDHPLIHTSTEPINP